MSTSKTILITGATAGIGRHAALHLASLGHHVIATGRKESALAELREQATQSGSRGRLSVLRLDVTDPASIAAVAREVSELTGGRGLDVLVNNAGYGLVAPLEEVTDAELRAQFDTNVFGLMAVTRAFLPQLRARGAARIVNVSSIGGRLTMPFFGAYNATKYAVESLSDALRMELLPFGIDVSLVEPGPIRSDFAARAMESVSAHASPDSPYAPVYARADEINTQTESMAVGPEHTSRAIAHAALARRPRARYVVPGRLALMIGLVGMLPTRLVDWVLRQSMGLTAKKLLGAPGQAVSRALAGKRQKAARCSAEHVAQEVGAVRHDAAHALAHEPSHLVRVVDGPHVDPLAHRGHRMEKRLVDQPQSLVEERHVEHGVRSLRTWQPRLRGQHELGQREPRVEVASLRHRAEEALRDLVALAAHADARRGVLRAQHGGQRVLGAGCRWLQLQVDAHLRQRAQHLAKEGDPHALAAKRRGRAAVRAEPIARVHGLELRQRERGERALAIGAAGEVVVVGDDERPVTRRLDVELQHVGAVARDGGLERDQGVLGRERGSAPVRDVERRAETDQEGMHRAAQHTPAGSQRSARSRARAHARRTAARMFSLRGA